MRIIAKVFENTRTRDGRPHDALCVPVPKSSSVQGAETKNPGGVNHA